MKTTVAQFVESLGRSKLLADEEVQTILGDLTSPSQTEDARGLAQSLVQQQKLTPYQATAVYQGKLSGLSIGNYVVLNRIGAGGMGAVFKAQHHVLKRIVAIKVLPRKFLSDANAVRRFRREVRAAAQLEHPNIVAAFDADEAGGVHFLVMEYVDGKDLSVYVKRHGPLSVEAALGCILQAARGLEHAHAKGIIHRDVKPANLLLDTTGTVKVLDMGLARLESTADYNESLAQSTLTSPGTVMGTVDYMAPEQALDSKFVDHRADIYSLGYTLFYLLTRKKAYRGDTLMQILMAHQQQPIPSLKGLRPEVPDVLEAAYRKMVAKDRGDRYQSMSACVAALEDVQREAAAAQQEANDSRTETLAVPSAEQEARENFQQFLQGLEIEATPTLIMPAPADDAAGAADAEQQSGLSSDSTIPIPPLAGVLEWVKRRPLPTISAGIALLLLCAVLWSIRGWFAAGGSAGGTDDQAQAANADSSASGSSANGEQQGPQWQTLFNGRDLTGWIVRGPESWTVESGVLVGQGHPSDLLTERDDYRNFHLRVECRINDGGNSGLFFRAAAGDASALDGYEAQIDHGSGRTSPYQTGSLYGVGPRGAIPQVALGPDEWFTQEVIADGNHIVIKVNGVVTFDFLDEKNTYAAGRLGLQLHDRRTVVEFRRIEVKGLTAADDADYALAFDGEDDYVELPSFEGLLSESVTCEGFVNVAEDGPKHGIPVRLQELKIKSMPGGVWFLSRVKRNEQDRQFEYVRSEKDVESGRRIHFAAVQDAQGIRLYVDGKLVVEAPDDWRISGQGSWLSPPGNWFRGLIDEVRISNVARYTEDFTPQRRFQPDEHTLALYHFDEGSGDVLKDASGNGHHGKIEGATWVHADGSPIQPPPNYALSFDGEDDYVDIPTLKYDEPTPMTIEVVVSDHRGPALSPGQSIVRIHGREGYLTLKYTQGNNERFAGWRGMAQIGDGSVDQSWNLPVQSQVRHIAFVWDGETTTLFADGKANQSQRHKPRQEVVSFSGSMIGANVAKEETDRPPSQGFHGLIHEVRVSNVARYTEDFTPQQRFEPDEHTLVLYHFDEGSGEVSKDASGNNHHGKIVGAKWVNADGSPIRPSFGPATSAAWSWSEPVNLGEAVNSAGNDQHPTLSADGLTLIFHGVSKRDGEAGERFQGDRELWICRRQSTHQPWGPAEKLRPPVASSEHDQDPTLSADGLTLVFASERPGGQGMEDLWISRRGSPDEPFGEPEHLDPPINTEHDERGPSLSRDGLWLAFASTRPGGYGNFDVWLCRRKTVSEPFGAPVNAGPLVNSAAKDRSPSLSNDGLTLLFSSNRPGGVGGQDLWIARRDFVDEPFGEPVNLGPPINTVQREDGPELWADGEYLLFGSQRPDAVGGMDLYISRRIPPPKVTGSLDLKLRQVIKGHASSVRALGLSADGQTLASYDMKEATRVWDLRTGRELATLQHPELSMGGAHRRLDISSDGGVIATTDESGRIALWDWRTGQTRATPFTADRSFRAAAFSPDGEHLAVASGKRVHLLDAGTLAEVGRIDDYKGTVNFATFSTDDRLLASGGRNGPIRFHAVPSLEEQFTVSQHFKSDFEGHATAGVFSRDGTLFAASDYNPQITVWDVASQKKLCVVGQVSPNAVAISPDNKLLAVAGKVNDEADGAAIRVWNISTGEQVAQISSGRETWLFGVTFTPDGQSLICNWFNAIHVWDLSAPPVDKPPAAAAPFNADQAKTHQQAWANHLGVPVEYSNSIGMKFRLIPPGEFLMGSTAQVVEEQLRNANSESQKQRILLQVPQRTVRLTNAFYLATTEVTQEQYARITGSNPAWFSATGEGRNAVAGEETGRRPVEQVSWFDAVDFCNALSKREALRPNYQRSSDSVAILNQNGYRLPTEAEWEFACRAGRQTGLWSGDAEPVDNAHAWHKSNSGGRTQPVGGLAANAFGLFDVHGNVWEWCQDGFAPYTKQTRVDPVVAGEGNGEERALRGGSYNQGAVPSSARNFVEAGYRSYAVGFRPVLLLEAVRQAVAWQAGNLSRGSKPQLAKAPFDARQAKSHQRVWAQHLRLPVERDVDLPGGQKLKMMLIPPGEFLMGSTAEEQRRFLQQAKAANDVWDIKRIPSEGPQHRVRITRPFYLGKYEVTQAQWQAVMGENPSQIKDPTHPVDRVGWVDIQPFLAKLNDAPAATGLKFVLPTAAEWEFACRAGTTTFWHSGDSQTVLLDYGWFDENSDGKPHSVGQLRPNAFGLYDMHGNAGEWCADWFAADYYAQAPVDDPSGGSGVSRVGRGGDWSLRAARSRSADRNSLAPDYRQNIGFRLAALLVTD